MALAIGAGANLPAAWAAVATGRDHLAATARVGERYQWLTGDLQAVFAEHARHAPAELFRSLRWAFRAHHSVWSVRDPVPGAWYLGRLLRSVVARARRRGATPTPSIP
jgi:hypothetical protein